MTDTPATPGEFLVERYLKPLGISPDEMARAVRMPPEEFDEIVQGKRAITPSISIRFAAFLGQADEFWHRVQADCDFRALQSQRAKLRRGIPSAIRLPKKTK